MPMPIMTNPPITEASTAVCTMRCDRSSSFEPRLRARMTFTPTDIPINRLTIRAVNEPVAPTAAPAAVFDWEKLPTTARSAALNRTWITPPITIGTEYLIIEGRILPSVMLTFFERKSAIPVYDLRFRFTCCRRCRTVKVQAPRCAQGCISDSIQR